jgi:hypothetical protein
MRKTVEDRIITLQRKTIVRPTVEVLAGLVGPDARACWDRLAAEGQGQRLNAVLRFLFAAVIIDEHRGRPVPSTTVALRSNPTPCDAAPGAGRSRAGPARRSGQLERRPLLARPRALGTGGSAVLSPQHASRRRRRGYANCPLHCARPDLGRPEPNPVQRRGQPGLLGQRPHQHATRDVVQQSAPHQPTIHTKISPQVPLVMRMIEF